MRAYFDLNQGVARRAIADPRHALATQTKNLPVVSARGNTDIEYRTIRQRDLLVAAVDRIKKIQRQPIVRVRTTHSHRGGTPVSGKNPRKDVVIDKIGKARVARILRALLSKVFIELPLRPLCSRGVDFTAVITRTLLPVAEEIVRCRHILELFLSMLVSRIEVRVQLFCQLPISLLNFFLRCVLLDA